ncbi:hypothetical protein BDN72DRAFT_899757 [Pluteus cervinus]|uniref:Uncharacterized protein n=1 Tax=Pluteus cervinus TaxID=181527 RepID=A0ACD3ANR1_9AGAR|nr:hypothetical protein BDN72DRAFT_899757 [Pluteus cervinus]
MRLNLNSPIASFPPELLHFILDEYRPVYDAEFIELIPTRKAKVPKNWALYASELHFFAQLRLVCRAWYNFITPLLYSTFTLPTHPYEDLERVSKGLNYYPKLVDHLVLRGHLGDGAVQHAVELLAACLSQCTEIRTLEILDAHRIFRSSSKSKSMAIFRALPSTVPLNRLIFRFPRRHTLRAYPISVTLLGLGPLSQKLETLEIHDPYERNDDTILDVPSTFPNLQRLVARSSGFNEYDLPKLVSRICYKVTPPSITLGSSIGSSSRHERAIRLRDLTLCWNGIPQVVDCIPRLLETDGLGRILTSLYIYSAHFHLRHDAAVKLLTFPNEIIAACPRLETFIYFIACPDTILTLQLPRTLKTLGLSLVQDHHHYSSWAPTNPKPLTLRHHKQLVDWLEKTNGGGIRKLLLQRWVAKESDTLVGLEDVKKACLAADIDLALSRELPTYLRR